MDNLTKINDNLYRMTTPYQDIYTTVYFIKTEEGVMIFDTASGAEDTENAILPALEELNVPLTDVKYVFISHNHRDHARGLPRLMEAIPDAVIVTRSDKLIEEQKDRKLLKPEDNDVIMSVLRVVTIPGHTVDSSAVFDTRTKTLITGDCLQVYGIFGSGNWACNVNFVPQHLEALEKVRAMDIDEVYTAHDYHPIGYKFIGKAEINKALDGCKNALLDIKNIIIAHPDADDERVRELFNTSGNVPKVNKSVVAAVRAAIINGEI